MRWSSLHFAHAEGLGVWGSAEVPFKLGGRGLEAFNWVGEVFTVWAREITWVKWGRKVTSEKID